MDLRRYPLLMIQSPLTSLNDERTHSPGIRLQVLDYICRIFLFLSFLDRRASLVHHNLTRLASFDSLSRFNFECAYAT